MAYICLTQWSEFVMMATSWGMNHSLPWIGPLTPGVLPSNPRLGFPQARLFKYTEGVPGTGFLVDVIRLEPETQTAGSEPAVWPTSFSG